LRTYIKFCFFDKGRPGAKGPCLPLKSLPTPDPPDALFIGIAGFYAGALIQYALFLYCYKFLSVFIFLNYQNFFYA